jgi:hypothetical protein
VRSTVVIFVSAVFKLSPPLCLLTVILTVSDAVRSNVTTVTVAAKDTYHDDQATKKRRKTRPPMNSSHVPICCTTEESAIEIRRQSFAILQIQHENEKVVQHAHLSARQYFSSDDERDLRDQRLPSNGPEDRPQVIDQGSLLGFNEPSPTKYVFRAYCDHPRQPWPRTHSDLQPHSINIASYLHELLIKILQMLCRHPCPLDISSFPVAPTDYLPSERYHPSQSSLRFETTNSSPIADRTGCPLDYFFYHNRQPHLVNCSEHVDRGLLIAICLTAVPGLEILLRDRFEWYCPEEDYVSRLSDPADRTPCTWIAILAGDSLRKYYKEEEIAACVHRVRSPLLTERLSISYELRLKMGL